MIHKIKKLKSVDVAGIQCGKIPFFLIVGPCVIEDKSLMIQTAEKIKRIGERLDIPVIFKSSFQKDNRSRPGHYRGPGIEEGLKILDTIKNMFEIPVISDVHHVNQVKMACDVLDILQIPAYLCTQTDLLEAVAITGKVINLKHGQFIAPENMTIPISKATGKGNDKLILTERGYTFGYNDLIVDPRSFHIMRELGYPVVFDVTHSVRKYGIPSSDMSGGHKEYLSVLGRAGVATGIDGLFVEVHPDPIKAKCDAATQLNLEDLEDFLKPLLALNAVIKNI